MYVCMYIDMTSTVTFLTFSLWWLELPIYRLALECSCYWVNFTCQLVAKIYRRMLHRIYLICSFPHIYVYADIVALRELRKKR